MEQSKFKHNADNDNRYKQEYYDAEGNLEWYHIYEFDDKGNASKFEHHDAEGNLEWYTLYKYDTRGNFIQSEYYDAEGNPIEFDDLIKLPH